MNEQIKKKVWLEFFKLKFWELFLGVYMTIGLYFVGKRWNPFNIEKNTFMDNWYIGFLINLIVMFILGIIFVWIYANWNWAESRVLAREKKGGKRK